MKVYVRVRIYYTGFDLFFFYVKTPISLCAIFYIFKPCELTYTRDNIPILRTYPTS